MSNGPVRSQETLSLEDMVKACSRVKELLERRAEHAKEKLDRLSQEDIDGAVKCLETSEELDAFNQMMQYSAKLADEVISLRRMITAMQMAEDDIDEDDFPAGFEFPTSFPN